MKPKTVGQKYSIGKTVPIQCVRNDTLGDLDIVGNCFLLLLLRAGSVSFRVGKREFEAKGPCFICFGEREKPVLLRKKAIRCNAVYFHPTFFNVNCTFQRIHSENYEEIANEHNLFLLRPFTDEENFVFPIYESWVEDMEDLFSGLEWELTFQRDWYWSCRSRSYLIELILRLERLYETQAPRRSVEAELKLKLGEIRNPRVKKMILYMENHYAEQITLDDLSRELALNRTSISALFKEETGMTPIEYLWFYRVLVAKKQMEFTNIPIREVALRCGFKTVQHFNRKFERQVGVTPAVYREREVARRIAAFER